MEYEVKHENNFSLANQTRMIAGLINNYKIPLAKKAIEDIIYKYPDDSMLLRLMARINIIEKDYESAVKNLEKSDIDYAYKNLSTVYLKIGDMDKLYKLYLKYYKETVEDFNLLVNSDEKNALSYYTMQIILRKLFNDFDDSKVNYDNLRYVDCQACNYSEEEAIDHIIRNHTDIYTLDKSKFYDDIKVKDLYYEIKKYIEDNKNQGLLNTLSESYAFSKPKCGYDSSGKVYNYIVAKVFINTSDIITMYPFQPKMYDDIIHLDDKKEYEVNHKIKVKSGLERFNERYKNL